MTQQILTLAILVVAIGLMISERLRADLVALLVIVVFSATGILTPQEAFSGFGAGVFITLLAVFILAEGLRRTGMAERVGSLLLRLSGTGERRLVTAVMATAALLSLFMNNIAAATLLLPAATGAARRSGVSTARLLMPLAFGTTLGGMATLLTTANIVVSGLLRTSGERGFGLLDFAPLGLPLAFAGIVYMTLWGRRRLPETSAAERGARQAERDLVALYGLGERLFRARIPRGSRLAGGTLAGSQLRETYGVSVVGVERDDAPVLAPPPDTVLEEGNVLLLEGRLEEFRTRDVEPYLEILPPRDWQQGDFASATITVVEAMLSPRSALIGRTLRDVRFRETWGMTVLGVWRGDRQLRTGLATLKLQFGDALLLLGSRSRIPALQRDRDIILLGAEPETPVARGRAWVALGIAAITLVFAAANPEAIGEILLSGAVGMVLSDALTMDEAYSAIEWKSLFLVAGMLPVGTALTRSGAAAEIGSVIGTLQSGVGPIGALAILVLLAMLLAQVMHGAAAAAIVAPIALATAAQTGLPARPLALGVAMACSMAFLTPLGHPVNILVMAPGGYRFRDFLRVGLPLTVALVILTIVLVPLLWPLAPGALPQGR